MEGLLDIAYRYLPDHFDWQRALDGGLDLGGGHSPLAVQLCKTAARLMFAVSLSKYKVRYLAVEVMPPKRTLQKMAEKAVRQTVEEFVNV
jgi:hypothetical protein